jgi:hypothetical protein
VCQLKGSRHAAAAGWQLGLHAELLEDWTRVPKCLVIRFDRNHSSGGGWRIAHNSIVDCNLMGMSRKRIETGVTGDLC